MRSASAVGAMLLAVACLYGAGVAASPRSGVQFGFLYGWAACLMGSSWLLAGSGRGSVGGPGVDECKRVRTGPERRSSNGVEAMPRPAPPSDLNSDSRTSSIRGRRPLVPPAILLFFAIDVGLILLYLADRFFFARWPLLTVMLDIDGEGSISNWYSVVQLALVGILLTTLLGVLPGWLDRLRIASASALFLFLSKEECIGFHDHLRTYMVEAAAAGRATSRFAITTDWMVWLAPPLIVAVLILGWRLAGILRGRRVAFRFAVGLGLLVGSSAGMEILLNYSAFWWIQAGLVTVCFEELGEMAGGTVLLWATCDLLGSYGVRIFARDPLPEARPVGVVPPPHLRAANSATTVVAVPAPRTAPGDGREHNAFRSVPDIR